MGGKHYLLKTLLKIIPPHRIYVEPFGGSAKLLLNKEPSRIEVYNDYDKHIANLFYVVVFKFEEFYEKISRSVYSRAISNQITEEIKKTEITELGDVDLAVRTYIKLQTSMLGQLKSTSFKISFEDRKPVEYSTSIERLKIIHERLKNVTIECTDFKKIIKSYKDIEDAFIFIDPPYFGVEHYYNVKFTLEDHKALLELLKDAKAKWLLAGFDNELYNTELKDFYKIDTLSYMPTRVSKGSKNSTTNKKQAPKEVLWSNYKIKL
jgi:DNA adenine methylase